MSLFPFQDVGSLGWLPDIPAHDLQQPDGIRTTQLSWNTIRNFNFRGGLAERSQGYGSGFGTVQQIPYFLTAATKTDGTAYLVAGGTSKVYSYTGTTATDISKTATTYSATADTRWTGGVFTGFVVLNNSVENPQFCAISNLGSANALTDLTNWPASTTCKVFRPFKYFLVAGYTTESATAYPYKVRWSNSAVPGALPTSWVASAANDAGSVDLSENDGEIIDMFPIGDQMAIFRRGGVWLMRYVGGTDAANRLVMAFNRVQASGATGILANNCADMVPGKGLVVLSESDVYLFNGSMAESIVNNRARKYLFNNIDPTNRKRAYVVTDLGQNDVKICFPSIGSTSCDVALVWNYVDNTLGFRDLPTSTCGLSGFLAEGSTATIDALTGTADNLTGVIDALGAGASTRKTAIGSAATKIYVLGSKPDNDGATLTAELRRSGINFGNPESVKYLKAIWPRFDAAAGQTITVTIGYSMWPDETYNYTTPFTYTVGTTQKVDIDCSGRFFEFWFKSTSGASWRIRSLEADVVIRGLY